MSRTFDVVVVGAGPAGLGAALAVARQGASVCVVDRAQQVGGLCVTREANGDRYDIGGHILFVRSTERERWLKGLLGEDLLWVDRAVARVQDGQIVEGRYLDAAAGGGGPPARPDQGGADYLDAMVGRGSSAARRYLEKIDGMALEDIPATRVERLLIGQAAPNGFYYPRNGIGQLMNAAAEAIRARAGTTILGRPVGAIDVAGSRTRGIVLGGSSGEEALSTGRVIVSVPIDHATRLAVPRAPTSATPALQMRAVAIVYLAAQVDRLTEEPWIQIDDPDVPFARLFEPANWSPALSQSGRTVIGCECYCQEGAQDPIWRHTDESLGRWCAEALTEVLGLIERPNDVELVEVVRLPRAYPVVPVSEIVRAIAPARWLSNVAGLEIAQGGAVIEAIEAGEAAAGRALADL